MKVLAHFPYLGQPPDALFYEAEDGSLTAVAAEDTPELLLAWDFLSEKVDGVSWSEAFDYYETQMPYFGTFTVYETEDPEVLLGALRRGR